MGAALCCETALGPCGFGERKNVSRFRYLRASCQANLTPSDRAFALELFYAFCAILTLLDF